MDETLIGSIVGGIISGGVGIIIAWYTSKLKDKEWMKQNVYPKLYDWIVSREIAFQFNDELLSALQTKSQLSSSQYSKLDKKIREKLEMFVKEGAKWDNMFGTMHNRFIDNRTKIIEDLYEPLNSHDLLKDNNIIKVGERGWDITGFLQPFFMVFIDPSIKNGEILYQKMKEYARKKSLYQLEYIEEIKIKRPEFFELISKNLPEIRSRLLLDLDYNDLVTQADKVRHTLDELKDSLKNKI